VTLWRAVVPVTLLLLAAAACGDGRPAASRARVTVSTAPLRTLPPDAAADPSQPLRTLPGPTTAAPPAPSPASPADAPAPTPFCDLLRRYNERAAQLGSAPPDRRAQLIRDITATIEQAAGVAPQAVRADMGTLASTHRRFLTALEQAGFDASRADPAAIQALRSEPFVGARDRVRAYNRTACA
jgi:hypothetical protein